jgi:hypothetical protein
VTTYPDRIDLPDGRRLHVTVSGPADGLPLMFHHGTPGARTGGACGGGELAIGGLAVLRPFLDAQHPHLKVVEAAGIVASMAGLLPDADRAVLTDEFAEDMAAEYAEALAHGTASSRGAIS